MGPSGSGKTSLLTVLGGRSSMKYKGEGETCIPTGGGKALETRTGRQRHPASSH
jgi:ABC-type lipoprotein export system ATPase subunit